MPGIEEGKENEVFLAKELALGTHAFHDTVHKEVNGVFNLLEMFHIPQRLDIFPQVGSDALIFINALLIGIQFKAELIKQFPFLAIKGFLRFPLQL